MLSQGSNLIPAVLVFAGVVAAAICGCLAGFFIGKGYKMTRREAASILAKASWKHRGYTR